MNSLQRVYIKINTAFSLDLVLILIGVGLLVYFSSLFNGFIGDDVAQIVNNETIKNFDSIILAFGKGTFTTGGAIGGLAGIYYKPLMTFFFAIVYSIFGLSPFGYHLLSLLLHEVNVVLLFFLARRFFFLEKLHFAQFAAFFVALVFLIHPGNSEAVSYIADTQDLLVMFFLLSSLMVIQNIIANTALGWKAYLILGFTFLGSLLSKESGIVVLLLVVAYVFLFAKKLFHRISLLALGIFCLYLFLRLQVAHIPLMQRLEFIPIHAASLQH